jgi:haloalkane dehalogenase
MASFKKLAKSVKQGLLFPYNSWNNRLATLKFVQDIPLKESDESYYIIKDAEANLGGLDNIPMLILWGIHDFVFDMDYFKEWQKRFPNAIFHTFSEAGHYILEDVPEKVLECIKEFLKKC